jgi:ketosteroid isomerase-like protein
VPRAGEEIGMSDQANLEFVQHMYEVADRGELQAFLDALTEDVQWAFPGPSARAPFFGEFHGRDEMLQALRPFLELVETRQLRPRQFIASGETVVVLEHEEIKVRRTGRTCELECVHILTLRDGRVATIKQIGDTGTLLQTLEG